MTSGVTFGVVWCAETLMTYIIDYDYVVTVNQNMSDLRIIIVNLYDITPKFIAALNKLVGSGYVDNSVSKLLYEQNAVHYIAVISKNLTLQDVLSLKKPLLGFVTFYETMDAVVLENLCTSKPYNGIAAQIIRESTVKVCEERKKPVLLFIDRKSYATKQDFENIINFYLGQMIGDHSDLPLFRHCERIGNRKYIDNTTTLWSLGKKYTYRDALIHYPIPSNSISTSALSASSSSEIHNQTNRNSTQSTPVSIDSEQSRKRRLDEPTNQRTHETINTRVDESKSRRIDKSTNPIINESTNQRINESTNQ